MATNDVQGNSPLYYSQQQVAFIRKKLTYQSATTILIGTLPAGALIVAPISGVDVLTVTNFGTNNRLNIGITGTTAKYGANLSTATAGFVPMAVAVGHKVTVDTDIYATLDFTGTAASTGDFDVVVAFVPDNAK